MAGEEFKISQFADDTTAFVKDERSAEQLFKVLNSFENISGLKLNVGKTEGLWLGTMRNSNSRPFGIKWPEGVKSLGIFFSYNTTLKDKMNFGSIANEMKTITNLWRLRRLTVFGKITLIKSLLLSKLTYKATMLCVPEEVIKSITSLIFNFLWSGPDKVKRKSTFGEFDRGGLRMTDVQMLIKSLKLTWISRLVSGEHKPWKRYIESKLETVGGVNLFLRSNFDMAKQENLYNISNFYKDVLRCWQNIKTCNKNPQNEILWNNKDFLVDGKPPI